MTKLSPRHKYAALMLALGHTHAAVCHELDLTPSTLSTWLSQQLFQDELTKHQTTLADRLISDITTKVVKRFDDHAESAAGVLIDLSESGELESTRLRAAKNVLEYSSFGHARSLTKQPGKSLHAQPPVTIVLGADFLQQAAAATKELTQGPTALRLAHPMYQLPEHEA